MLWVQTLSLEEPWSRCRLSKDGGVTKIRLLLIVRPEEHVTISDATAFSLRTCSPHWHLRGVQSSLRLCASFQHRFCLKSLIWSLYRASTVLLFLVDECPMKFLSIVVCKLGALAPDLVLPFSSKARKLARIKVHVWRHPQINIRWWAIFVQNANGRVRYFLVHVGPHNIVLNHSLPAFSVCHGLHGPDVCGVFMKIKWIQSRI